MEKIVILGSDMAYYEYLGVDEKVKLRNIYTGNIGQVDKELARNRLTSRVRLTHLVNENKELLEMIKIFQLHERLY